MWFVACVVCTSVCGMVCEICVWGVCVVRCVCMIWCVVYLCGMVGIICFCVICVVWCVYVVYIIYMVCVCVWYGVCGMWSMCGMVYVVCGMYNVCMWNGVWYVVCMMPVGGRRQRQKQRDSQDSLQQHWVQTLT